MALNVVSLTASIKAAFVAGGADPLSPLLNAMAAGIAQAIVTEITTNAVVVPTLLIAPVGGGPVTGTATIT